MDRTKKPTEAPIAGPGVIAGQQADPKSGTKGIASQPGRAADVAVGTPGASDQVNPQPQTAGTGLSGSATNEQAPFGGRTDNPGTGKAPPDMVEEPPPPKR